MSSVTRPFRDYNSYLREQFGCRVQKISVDAGLSCPNRDGSRGRGGCVYCNARGSGTGAAAAGRSITEQLENAKSYLAKRYKAKKFLAYFQSFSNTYAPLPRLRSLYGEALSVADVVGLTIGTRPDCVADDVLHYLAELQQDHLVWLEYGLQSAHERTLRKINRGHGIAEFIDAMERTRRLDLPVCVHIILGLPGESEDDMLETARFLASMDIQAVKIHLLYVIRGTILESWYRDGSYRCLEREAYAALVGRFLALLPPRVIVQRITGDPHREELVAPAWALEKQRNLQAILDYMRDRGLRQGCRGPQEPQ